MKHKELKQASKRLLIRQMASDIARRFKKPATNVVPDTRLDIVSAVVGCLPLNVGRTPYKKRVIVLGFMHDELDMCKTVLKKLRRKLDEMEVGTEEWENMNIRMDSMRAYRRDLKKAIGQWVAKNKASCVKTASAPLSVPE